MRAAGKMPTEEVSVRLSLPVPKDSRRTEHSATPTARKVTTVSDQSAGKSAHMASLTLELIASNQVHTVEGSAMHSGTSTSARSNTQKAVRNGVHCTTPNAKSTSTMRLAAFAHQTAHQV